MKAKGAGIMQTVTVEQLVKEFGKTKAVKGINFTIDHGEIFGLIGPNGAGKTTTLRIIATLLQITKGSVHVLGIDVEKNPDQVRKHISYLPEDAGAYKNLTGRQYLQFIANFFPQEEPTMNMIQKGITIADLHDRIDDKVDTYSKGMKRRLLVGRALMSDPKLAILDEPTSGLDVRNAQEIRKIIKNTAQEGTTVLLSSHNMLEVEYLCDRIALIAEGQIIEEGKPHDLMKKYHASNIEEVFMTVVQ
jgi:ABC-2 type transport system ATP-binding protein